MDKCVKALSAAMLLQAAKDYCKTQNDRMKKKILKDLRSDWVCFLTSDFSLIVAESLENHEPEIAKRLKIVGGAQNAQI